MKKLFFIPLLFILTSLAAQNKITLNSHALSVNDTAAMLAFAHNKVDTVYRTPGKDSIQFYINGRYHAIKDSAGGSGTDSASYHTVTQVNDSTYTLDRPNGTKDTIRFSQGSSGITSIATTSPITGGPITSTGTIGINNAAADGSTKGAASFTANDFDASSGNISLDYTNGQKASSSVPGFATSNQVIGVIGDYENGNGQIVTAGSKGYITIPYAFTITNWSVNANVSGTIQFDIKVSGTSIVGAGNKPALSSQQNVVNTAVSGWTTTTFAANTTIEWVVDSSPAPASITICSATLKIIK